MRVLTGRGEFSRPFRAGLLLIGPPGALRRANTPRRFQRRGQIRTLLEDDNARLEDDNASRHFLEAGHR
jgi:hypothetical protein